jgi:tRNA nucleotidyltransferase/poly(A) polymerase
VKPDSAIEIIHRLREHQHEAYLVGGCVRDMVMKIEPSDYDIATSATPPEIMKLFPRTEPIGVQFGVVLVIHRGHPFEVATFRSDAEYTDGRRPSGVVFTDARTDVQRRDFTINGLLYDPVDKRVIDYVEGQSDIRDRIVRAIGNPEKRFEEDKLRLLRAIRFGARLGYSIEPATWKAVQMMAPAIRQVSAERVREELARILTEGRPALGFRLLHESGLLAAILPEISWDEHIERSLELIPQGVGSDFAFGILLHEVPVETVERIVEGLKMSLAESRHILALVRNRARFKTLRSAAFHEMKRFMRLPRFEDHLELVRICATASRSSLDDYSFALETRGGWSEEDLAPQPLVSGGDLISLGFTPGPLFKEILTRVEDEQLDGRLKDSQQAIAFIKERYAS